MATRRKRRIVGAILLLGLPWVLYGLLLRMTEPESVGAEQWLFPVLVVVTLGLAGVLIRNLVKLIVERRRGILGSKLRFKLVFFFLALVLLPAIVLFVGSAHVIKHSVDRILRTADQHLRQGDRINEGWRDYFRQEARKRATALAGEIVRADLLVASRRSELVDLLERRVAVEGLAVARVVDAGRKVVAARHATGAAGSDAMEQLIVSALAESAASGGTVDRFDRLDDGLVALAVAPIGTEPSPGDGAVVAVALELPRPIVVSLKSIDAAVNEYHQLRYKRRDLVRLYVTLIGLIFIATLFVATWIGWYVARRITEPIQEVAAATREVSAGNMDIRVHSRVGDEMAMLVDAFNEMAGELQENREVITRSTAELRRSNLALDERRRYIEILVANLSTAVVSLDPRGRVTTANPAVETILGVVLAPGTPAATALRQAELGALADLVDQACGAEGVNVRRDVELPERAPKQHVSVQVSPLEGRSGERLGSLLMVEDLSDLRRAQRALAWQDVARRIAHEIKNPLTPIQLSAQRLRKKFFAGSDDLDHVLLEATASIEREVAGLKQLVDEFSRFARMPQIEPEPVEFAAVIDSVLSLYKGHTGVAWQVDVDPSVGPIRADPQQLRRALINLIDNALAAMNEQGTIRIGLQAIGGTGTVRIEVADTGPGISSNDRDKMFTPYFSTKKRGTGLGLAIVHKVVTDHGGSIRIEDNAPHGARFVIELPPAS